MAGPVKIPPEQFPVLNNSENWTEVFAGQPMGGQAPAVAPPPPAPPLAPPPATVINPSVPAIQDAEGNGATPAPPPTLPPEPSFGGPSTVTLTERETTQNKYDKKEVDKLDKLVDAEIEAGQAAANAQKAINDEAAANASLRATQMQKELLAEEEANRQRQEALSARMQEIDAAVNEYAGMKVDPNRLWASQSTGDKVMAGFAMLLGALGQAGAGGPNMALEAIDKAINRDIDAQKANIEKAGNAINMRHTVYQDLRQRFNDDGLARAAVREMTFAKLAVDAEAKAAATKNPLLQANFAQQAAALRSKHQEAAVQRSTITEKVARKETPVVSAAASNKPPVDLFSGEEGKEINAINKSLRLADDMHEMLNNPEVMERMGPVDAVVDRFRSQWGLEVDSDIVKAAQQGNLIAKAYLQSVSGMGVTDAERKDVLKTIMPTMNQTPQVAMARLENFTKMQMNAWDQAAATAIARKGYDPRVRQAVLSLRFVPRSIQEKSAKSFKKSGK